MTFQELQLHDFGNYDITIKVEPPTNMRTNQDKDIDESVRIAKIHGGTLSGPSDEGLYEVNLMAPPGVEEHVWGNRIVLGSFGFKNLQLDGSDKNTLWFKGDLAAVDVYSQEVYDTLVWLDKVRDFEKHPDLTDDDWLLRPRPPANPDAQQFIGWQVFLFMTLNPVLRAAAN